MLSGMPGDPTRRRPVTEVEEHLHVIKGGPGRDGTVQPDARKGLDLP